MNKISFSIVLVTGLLFQGCALKEFFTIGEQETFQEQRGLEYKNCGTSAGFTQIMRNPEYYKKNSYKNCIVKKEKGYFWDSERVLKEKPIEEWEK